MGSEQKTQPRYFFLRFHYIICILVQRGIFQWLSERMKSLSCSCPNNIWIFFPHDAQLKIEVSYLQLIFNIAPTPSKTWHSRTCSLSMTMTTLVQHCSSGYWSNIITNNRTEAPLRACSTDSCLCRNSEGRQNTTPPPPPKLSFIWLCGGIH